MHAQDLVRLRAAILFRYNSCGRMLTENDPEDRPAPRFFVGYTPGAYDARFSTEVSDRSVCSIEAILEREGSTGDLEPRPELLARLRTILEEEGPVAHEGGGPTYRFPETIGRTMDTVQVTEANVELACDTYPWLLTELQAWWPCFAVVRDVAMVSVCFSARIGAAACEAGVDTLVSHRGQGYASAVTAAWAEAIRRSGRIPLYSTSWDNVASQRVARRLGLIKYGADATLS